LPAILAHGIQVVHAVDVAETPEKPVLVPHSERSERAEKPLEKADEPPVVARMVIEIRSDGSRTIARGALQDAASGQEVAVHAEGTTPLALAASLARTLVKLPLLTGGVFRKKLLSALLPQRREGPVKK
jgi:hypothetical protein